MNGPLRFVVNAVVGLVVGLTTVFIGVVTALVAAFTLRDAVFVPGLVRIWASEENAATAINVDPNFAGMGLIALAIAAMYCVVATFAPRLRNRRTGEKLH